jgi:hypothetical protein
MNIKPLIKFMKSLTLNSMSQNAAYALISAAAILSMLFFGFFIAEPSVSYGQLQDTTPDFYIRQTITAESAFAVDPQNVTMAGDIAGLTGGNATGTTQFVVRSTNATGYYVEISFEDNAGDESMRGDVTGSEAIRDLDDGGVAVFGFTASTASQFGYTVMSSTTADTDNSFDYNGSTCEHASNDNADGSCWKAPTTTAYQIIDRGSPAVNGATSTIQFKVNVPFSPSPSPTAETYTATATLSLFNQ